MKPLIQTIVFVLLFTAFLFPATLLHAETEIDEETEALNKKKEPLAEIIRTERYAKIHKTDDEAWKGKPSDHVWELSLLTGLEILDGAVGLPVKLAAAREVNSDGWIDDINDSIFVELMMGPLLISNASGFTYSLHLKWNFLHSENQGLYAILGIGGLFTGTNLGDRDRIYPRLAVGAFMPLAETLWLRGEISQEMIVTGVSLAF